MHVAGVYRVALGNRKNRREGRPGPKPATARHY